MFFRLIQHLLPNALAWRIGGAIGSLSGVECGEAIAECGEPDAESGNTFVSGSGGKMLARFFLGLSSLGQSFRPYADRVFLDIFPNETDDIEGWEAQFGIYRKGGLTELERRSRLAGAWKALGGQSPRYIQDTLQGRGFDVYIHEWWEPGTNPPTARDPRNYLGDGNDGYIIVSKVTETTTDLIVRAGDEDVRAGEDFMQAGNFSEFQFVEKTYEPPDDPDLWPYFLYIGGETFPNVAQVPVARRDEFEELCQKIKPAQQWLGILVEYV